jgi:chromosome partitioning protein
MIVLVGGEKGGTGKTTIATNLAAIRAAAGRDVLLVDTDTQQSATSWAEIRTEEGVEPKISCIQLKGKGVTEELRKLSPRYDDVVIDAGGRDSIELRQAMLVAQVMLIPARPSQFDIHGLAAIDRVVGDVQTFNQKLRAYVVVNCAPTHATMTDADDMREVVGDLTNVQLADAVLRDRVAFRRAARDGLAVTEQGKGDEKAMFEMRRLYKEMFETAKEAA